MFRGSQATDPRINNRMVFEMTILKPETREDEQEIRWRAVLERNRGFDSAFVYAVRSTGIYCLCSCPSRKPAREQVVFYTGRVAAEQGGFRACRRCRPDQHFRAD